MYTRTTLTLVLALPFLSLPVFAQPNCSIATVVGTYAVRGEATFFLPLEGAPQPVPTPGVHIGVASVEPNGQVTARYHGPLGGQYYEGTGTGTLEVKSDCTAVWRYTLKTPVSTIQGTMRHLILDDGDGMVNMPVQGTLKAVGGETWRRLSRVSGDLFTAFTPCTADMVRGTYAFIYRGAVLMTPPGANSPVPVPLVMSGLTWVEPSGNMVMKASLNSGGDTVEGTLVTPPGALKVFANCLASMPFYMVVPSGTPPQGHDWSVIVDGGKEIWSVTTKGIMGAPMILGTYKQLSVQPPR